jgi:hypothetical protein
MTDSLVFEDRGSFVVVRYHGTFSAHALIDSSFQLIAYCTRNNRYRVLADVRDSVGDLTAEDRLVIANNMNHNFLPTIRLALFVRADQENADRTWETALSAYGLAGRSFTDEATAIAWLLSDPA